MDHLNLNEYELKIILAHFMFLQGYLFISVMMNHNSELFKLVVQNIKNDLTCTRVVFVNLALQCIANIRAIAMAEAFCQEVPKLIFAK